MRTGPPRALRRQHDQARKALQFLGILDRWGRVTPRADDLFVAWIEAEVQALHAPQGGTAHA